MPRRPTSRKENLLAMDGLRLTYSASALRLSPGDAAGNQPLVAEADEHHGLGVDLEPARDERRPSRSVASAQLPCGVSKRS
jgi:hypothetical protein